jgi:hypothetical protein
MTAIVLTALALAEQQLYEIGEWWMMRRTKHHVYYLHDERNAVVYIIAMWGAPKVGIPTLFDPRER